LISLQNVAKYDPSNSKAACLALDRLETHNPSEMKITILAIAVIYTPALLVQAQESPVLQATRVSDDALNCGTSGETPTLSVA
jgi:hypothetical protein